MRKWSKIIYSGNGWDMTVRELMFSIVIILIMLMGGFFISEKIASHNDEQNQEYYQAMQIDGNAELFQYGMRTDVGNAFVKGNLVAVDPVTDPGIGGVPAAYIKVEEQLQYRTAYNNEVRAYKKYVRKFPHKQILGVMGYEVINYDYLEYSEEDRQPVSNLFGE